MTYTTIHTIREALGSELAREEAKKLKAWEHFENAAHELGISLDEAVEHPEASGWYDSYNKHREKVWQLEASLEDFLSNDWH